MIISVFTWNPSRWVSCHCSCWKNLLICVQPVWTKISLSCMYQNITILHVPKYHRPVVNGISNIYFFQTKLFVYDLSRKKYKKQARNNAIYWRWGWCWFNMLREREREREREKINWTLHIVVSLCFLPYWTTSHYLFIPLITETCWQ